MEAFSLNCKVSATKSDVSDGDVMTDEIIQAVEQPPIKTPVCHSITQIDVLHTLGNFLLAARYEPLNFCKRSSHC